MQALWIAIVVIIVALYGCAGVPTTAMESSCERTTMGNYCYWSGGEPNGAGNGPVSAGGASHSKSATSGGMARGSGASHGASATSGGMGRGK